MIAQGVSVERRALDNSMETLDFGPSGLRSRRLGAPKGGKLPASFREGRLRYPAWVCTPMALPEMSAEALRGLLDLLESTHIPFWLDGGWGVDALLGEQTRHHKDVDLILRASDVPEAIELLADRGFSIQDGVPPDSFVLADGSGLEVDVHAVVFDLEGNGHYRMQNGGMWIYPSEGFLGHGSVEGRRVPCLTPTAQVLCHAHGYEPTIKDLEDMRRLEERFAVILPPHLKPHRHIPTTEESA